MAYVVNLKRSTEKELERLPARTHDKIVTRLISLQYNPRPKGAKKLHGREAYRIRAGAYRILYVIDDSGAKIEVFITAGQKTGQNGRFESRPIQLGSKHIPFRLSELVTRGSM